MIDFPITVNVPQNSTLNINLSIAPTADLEAVLNSISDRLTLLGGKVNDMAATIQDVQAAVTDETTVVQSAVTLLGQIHQMLVDAQAANDPAAVQAVIDQIAANKQALADAVAANTPAAPTQPTP